MKVLCWGKEQREEIERIKFDDLQVGKLTREIARDYFIKSEPSIILFDDKGHSVYECKSVFTPRETLKRIIRNHKDGKKGWDLLEA